MPTPTIDNETEKRLRSVWKVRHAARTNPWVLAWILGYNDVIPEVHGPLVNALPQFRGGTDSLLSNGEISYTPTVPLWKLETRSKTPVPISTAAILKPALSRSWESSSGF